MSKNAACVNCENGILRPGKYGRYCVNCDTYLPTGKANKLADRYFDALDAGDNIRASEIKIQLETLRIETIETVINAD